MSALPVSSARRRWLRGAIGVTVLLAAIWLWPGGRATERGRAGAEPARGGPGGGSSSQLASEAMKRRPRPRVGTPSRPALGLIRVRGVVVDAVAGTPVGDVEVVFADGTTEASAMTDAAGRYSIDVRRGSYRPFVRAEGMLSVGRASQERIPTRPRVDEVAMSRLEVAPALVVNDDLDGVDLQVVRSGIVHGRVFDRDGRPVAGAIVRALVPDPFTPRPVLGTDLAETDLDGTFELELASASYFLDAVHDRYGAIEARQMVEVEPGGRHEVDLTMYAGCIVTGRVVFSDGEPAGEGAIERSAMMEADAYFPVAGIEDGGEFRWSAGEVGEVALRAWPWKATHSGEQRFQCRDGARFDDVVFEVPRVDADLGGRIVTAAGRPAASAYLDIVGLTPGTMNQQERADEQGQWEVYALPDGTYRVTAFVDGEGAAVAELTVPDRGHILRLSGSGSMAGQVQGIVNGSFVLMIETCIANGQYVGTPFTSRVVAVRGGRYRVDGLPACDLGFVAAAASHRTRGFESITSGGVTNFDFDLRAPQTKTVRGSVKNFDGEPLPNVAVAVVRDEGIRFEEVGSTKTDARGRFEIAARDGDRVSAGFENSSMTVEISPGDDEVELRVDPDASLAESQE